MDTGAPAGGFLIETATVDQVVIGKKSKKKNQRETGPQQLSAGEMVLVDMEKYADEWPQVAQIVSIGDTNISMQWFKGSKSTAWTPATRRVKGCRGGKTEPFTEIVNKSVIWHGGFSLTPSGLLPKAIKEAIDCYFDE